MSKTKKIPNQEITNQMNQLKKLTNQELLAEVKARIIAGTIEVEWEDTYGDSSTIINLSTRTKNKKWYYLNFTEALTECSQRKKLEKENNQK